MGGFRAILATVFERGESIMERKFEREDWDRMHPHTEFSLEAVQGVMQDYVVEELLNQNNELTMKIKKVF